MFINQNPEGKTVEVYISADFSIPKQFSLLLPVAIFRMTHICGKGADPHFPKVTHTLLLSQATYPPQPHTLSLLGKNIISKEKYKNNP